MKGETDMSKTKKIIIMSGLVCLRGRLPIPART